MVAGLALGCGLCAALLVTVGHCSCGQSDDIASDVDFHCEPALLETVSLLQKGVHLTRSRDDDQNLTPKKVEDYYWSSRGRNAMTNSYVPYTAPSNFSTTPSWIWPNEILGQVRHSPLIDNELNIYVTTEHAIRKFSPDGDVLWTWEITLDDGRLNACPALYNGEIFALANPGDSLTVIAISMASGTTNWQNTFQHSAGTEASSLSVYDGVVFFGAGPQGVSQVVAANASDGNLLWEYDSGEVMWNFAPSSPGDGSLIFASSCGVVTRLSFAGELMWKAGGSHPGAMCGPGGGALGPSGVFYSEFNRETKDGGRVAAYLIADGSFLWEKQFDLDGNQYPAVGQLGSTLAVVIGVGDNPKPPSTPSADAAEMDLNGPMRNKIYALDAETGETLWVSEEPPWNHPYGAGELDEHGEGEGSACWPDPQGIPLITGDGTVYASSSHGGQLRAIRDANGDGQIDAAEVSTLETDKCFLNSPSAAPGMLVAAPCWGPMYVFKA